MTAGWKGLFAIEKDENAFASLSGNLMKQFAWPKWLPKSPHGIDEVLKTHREALLALRGKVDLLAGGPPCQGFSSAGRRVANDPRNHLTTSYLNFVSLVKPKIALIENVKGIAVDFDEAGESSGKINYAKRIIQTLSEDYIVHSRVLDTSLFGVPQKRKRFFIIAVRKGISFSVAGTPFELLESLRHAFLAKKGISAPVSSKSAISDLEVRRNGVRPSKDSENFYEIAYKKPLTAYQRLMNAGVGACVTDTRLARHSDRITLRFEKLIELCHEDGRLNVSISPELRASFGLKKCAIRVLDPENPSPTITSMPDDLIHYGEPRTLTVRENARLQSFPDTFIFRGKYTTGGDRRRHEVPRFTQVANAVPPLVAEALGRALMAYLHPTTSSAAASKRSKDAQMFRGAQAIPA